MDDEVKNPKHYQGKGGVECIEITEHLPFCVGNAYKYVYRRDAKGNPKQDLKKALWYVERELALRAESKKLEPSEIILRNYRVSDSETDERVAHVLDAIVEGHALGSDKSFEYAASLLRELIDESETG